MPLKQITQESPKREIILGYGPPTSGKTRLFTSLTPRFGKIAYIAIDEGSETLDSVLPHYRERITVFQPDFKDSVIEAAAIAITDWKSSTPPDWLEDGPLKDAWTGFDTLVLDTFSNLTRLWLHDVTQKGLFQEKRNMIGEPGKPGSIALPDRGHYNGVFGIIRNFRVLLFRNNPNLHIIVICHEALDRDDVSGRILSGGPATVGRAMIGEWASHFKTVIRTVPENGKPVIKGGKTHTPIKFMARMSQHGPYVARRNEASLEGNPLPSLELEIDPQNFWVKYDETSPLLLEGATN